MLITRITVCLAIVSLEAAPVLAQSSSPQPMSQMASGDVASAAADAVKTLGSTAKDKLFVRDLLGAPVSGPGGGTVGTVADLVVIPGGRVVAAIIATKDKKMGHIPVPFSVAKVSNNAGKLELALPVSLSELKGMKEVQSLAHAIPGKQ